MDLGAGHGRIVDELANLVRNLISIEINPEMLPELRKRSQRHGNAEVIDGDITKLSSLLEGEDVQNPVLLLLQNTLGTIEGSWKEVLREMKTVATEENGEVVLSFFL